MTDRVTKEMLEAGIQAFDEACTGSNGSTAVVTAIYLAMLAKDEKVQALVRALEKAGALIENLWEAVPWGQTFNLDIMALNEAPIAMKRALAQFGGNHG